MPAKVTAARRRSRYPSRCRAGAHGLIRQRPHQHEPGVRHDPGTADGNFQPCRPAGSRARIAAVLAHNHRPQTAGHRCATLTARYLPRAYPAPGIPASSPEPQRPLSHPPSVVSYQTKTGRNRQLREPPPTQTQRRSSATAKRTPDRDLAWFRWCESVRALECRSEEYAQVLRAALMPELARVIAFLRGRTGVIISAGSWPDDWSSGRTLWSPEWWPAFAVRC